jgi:hypothetical protein
MPVSLDQVVEAFFRSIFLTSPFAFLGTCNRAKQPTHIGNSRRDQASRSRKSSDSSLSFVLVDSN